MTDDKFARLCLCLSLSLSLSLLSLSPSATQQLTHPALPMASSQVPILWSNLKVMTAAIWSYMPLPGIELMPSSQQRNRYEHSCYACLQELLCKATMLATSCFSMYAWAGSRLMLVTCCLAFWLPMSAPLSA